MWLRDIPLTREEVASRHPVLTRFASQLEGFNRVRKQRYTSYIQRWLAGEETGMKSDEVLSRHVHRYLRETRGEKCEECGWAEINPKSGRIPIHIDHIDGDYRHTRPENLRILCPNHHALTPFYGSLNRGNGRPFHVVKQSKSVVQ